ncbi:MAG: hypothetical protein V7K46_26530 [Nostoc sp.]
MYSQCDGREANRLLYETLCVACFHVRASVSEGEVVRHRNPVLLRFPRLRQSLK